MTKIKLYEYAIKGVQQIITKIEDDFKDKVARKNNLTHEEVKELKENARQLSYLQGDIESLQELVYKEYNNYRPRKMV